MSDTGENHDQGDLEDQLRKSVERWIKHHPLSARPQDVRAGVIFLGIVMVGAFSYIMASHRFILPVLFVLALMGVIFCFMLFD